MIEVRKYSWYLTVEKDSTKTKRLTVKYKIHPIYKLLTFLGIVNPITFSKL